MSCLLYFLYCGDIIDCLPAQVRLNLISMQSHDKLKALLTNLHQSLAAKVVLLCLHITS